MVMQDDFKLCYTAGKSQIIQITFPQGCNSCRAVWLQWHPGRSADGCVLQGGRLVLVAPATQHLHVHDVVSLLMRLSNC